MNANIVGRFLLMFAALPDIASAQAATPPTLQAFIASPQFQSYIGGLFSKLPPDVFRRCSSLVSKGSTVVVSTPATFASDGHPVSGAWKQSFPVSGCGNATTINFFFAVQASGNIVTTLGVPGESHADAVLQKDAIRYAVIAANIKAATCADTHVLNTTFDGKDSKQPINNNASLEVGKTPWHETWTLSGCGEVVRVKINFIPDPNGTTISTQPIRAAE